MGTWFDARRASLEDSGRFSEFCVRCGLRPGICLWSLYKHDAPASGTPIGHSLARRACGDVFLPFYGVPMPLPETNFALIARMKRPADERAWQEFVGAYEPFLLRMLVRRGLSDTDSHDVVQQIFLAVCRSLKQWNPDGEEGSFRRCCPE